MNTNEHLLICLIEECLEVELESSLLGLSKNASKALRFGINDRNVLNPEGPTNRERIIDELNDLMGVVRLLAEYGIIPIDWSDIKKQNTKMNKVEKFMKYAKDTGALNDQ